MSKHSSNNLFTGLFYLNSEYAISLIPSLYKEFVLGIESSELSEKERIDAAKAFQNGTTPNTSEKRVAILNIHQPIIKYSNWSYLGTKSFANILKSFERDDSISGVVLDIDSGGGQVYGTPGFYDVIKDFSKPIVAYTDGYLCSAAYYIGNATDFIIANKRADHIGSIGAYATMVNFDGVFEKLGAKVYDIYASKSTEKNKAYRELMNEGNEKPYIENVLDPIVETFHNDMKSQRPQLKKEVFKGGTWNGEAALDKGLIDEIGTLQTAIDKVFELSKKNKTQKANTMSKTEFNRIQATLGLETALESNAEGVYLNEDQLQTIEDTLEAQQTAIDGAPEALQTAVNEATQPLNDRIAELESVDTEASTQAIDTALEAAEIDRGEMSNIEAVQALSNLLTEYGKKDGASTTNVVDDATATVEENTNVIGGIDISAAMNN